MCAISCFSGHLLWRSRTLFTVAHNFHGKRNNLAAKRKRLTAKGKTSRQKRKDSPQKKAPHCKRKTSRQKEKDSRQKKRPHGEVIPFALRLFFLLWGFFFVRESFSFFREVFLLRWVVFFLPWGFFFGRESFLFCCEVLPFAVRLFLWPWGYFFGREVISLAWQLWATVLIDLERSKNTIGTTIISGETEVTVSGFSSYRLRSSCEVVWRIQRRWLEKRVHRSRLKKSRVSPF